MSRKSRSTLSAVEKLIEQRRLFQDWLTKLAAGVDGMPSHVIERVKNDYRARLEAVLKELTEHQDALREVLAEAQQRQEAIERQQAMKRDELAELRLRKHVGELEDQRFRELHSSLKSAIDALTKELASALRDIDRYEEILETIATSEVPPAPEEEPEHEPELPLATALAAKPREGGRPTSAPPKVEDELAFLRSVVMPAVPKPPPGQKDARSVKQEPRAPVQPDREAAEAATEELVGEEPAPQAAHAPAPPVAEQPRAQPAPVPPAAEPKAEEKVSLDAAPYIVELPEAAAPAESAPAPVDKQAERAGLECKECGTINRPTEWYCEKCGAELAAF